MLFQKIDFHNVEEMVKTEKGYCMSRFPQHVREKLNPGVRELSAFYCTGVELRFKLRSEKAVIILRSAMCVEAQVAYIYYGSIQGGMGKFFSSYLDGRYAYNRDETREYGAVKGNNSTT